MPQDITNFYRVAQVRDFARQFQFRLIKFGPVDFGEDELIYVETASLPGRSITNVTVPFMGLGFNIPGTATYPGSTGYAVTFRCDQNYDLRHMLEADTFNTFNDENSTGLFKTPQKSNEIIFALYDKQGRTLTRYHLYGAYVVSVGDSAYNVGDSGTIVTVQATLAYQFWRKEARANSADAKGGMPLATSENPLG